MATPTKGDQSFAKLPAAAKIGLGFGLVALMAAVYYFALHLSLDDDLEQANTAYTTLQTRMQSA